MSCGSFLKSLFNLLQYCFCFMFWNFGHDSCGILAEDGSLARCIRRWSLNQWVGEDCIWPSFPPTKSGLCYNFQGPISPKHDLKYILCLCWYKGKYINIFKYFRPECPRFFPLFFFFIIIIRYSLAPKSTMGQRHCA